MEPCAQSAGQVMTSASSTMAISGTHALKFQAITAPDGLITHLFGPVEGRRHDSGVLGESGLLPQLGQNEWP